MIYLFLTCLYVWENFQPKYYTYIIFNKGKLLYIRRINLRAVHARGSGSNNECIPHDAYFLPLLIILGFVVYA